MVNSIIYIIYIIYNIGNRIKGIDNKGGVYTVCKHIDIEFILPNSEKK